MKTPFLIIVIFLIVSVICWLGRMMLKGGGYLLGGILLILLFLLKIVFLTFVFVFIVGVITYISYLIGHQFGQPWEGISLLIGMIGGFYLYRKFSPLIDRILEK